MTIIYIVQGEHPYQSASPMTAHATVELANVQASSLLNIIIDDIEKVVEGKTLARSTPKDWEKVQARIYKAVRGHYDQDDFEVWITALVVQS